MRWFVNLRRWTCYLFSLLRIHSPNCEHCNIRDTYWVEAKKRLEELLVTNGGPLSGSGSRDKTRVALDHGGTRRINYEA
jgi:hypothetical protein